MAPPEEIVLSSTRIIMGTSSASQNPSSKMSNNTNSSLARTNDLITISNLSLDSMNETLKERYNQNVIYTACSPSILISLNPYTPLPIYNLNSPPSSTTPHIYTLTSNAYNSLITSTLSLCPNPSQSILISGESGAGKTETMKFILQYLCWISSHSSSGGGGLNSNGLMWVEQQIIEANTVLEAFGNATTPRNTNSSRFGKFTLVSFSPTTHKITGCYIYDYLLEQSRITPTINNHDLNDRNYHIFYLLTIAGEEDRDLRERYKLKSGWWGYKYLNENGEERKSVLDYYTIDKWESLRLALDVLKFNSEMQDGLFKIISAVLWFGEIEITCGGGNDYVNGVGGDEHEVDQASVPSSPNDMPSITPSSTVDSSTLPPSSAHIVTTLSYLLSIPQAQILQLLTTRQINIKGNIMEIPLKVEEATSNLHSMSKYLYTTTFKYIIHHINDVTNPCPTNNSATSNNFISLLDIFGFENFNNSNSFEQLCINYANEKLQNYFNFYVVKSEVEMYKSQGLMEIGDMDSILSNTSTDNTNCLEMIEKPPKSILRLLSEQCHLPRGSDASFHSNITTTFSSHPSYSLPSNPLLASTHFVIHHYAGPVTYNVSNFVHKNRDNCQTIFNNVILSNCCENEFLKRVMLGLGNFKGCNNTETVSTTLSKAKPTVTDTFKTQLTELLDVLYKTKPWYVRCIKPNTTKSASNYSDQFVLEQLGYLGMLEVVKVKRYGWPVHYEFREFLEEYGILLGTRFMKTIKFKGQMKPMNKSEASKIIESVIKTIHNYDKSSYTLGTTKIFLKSSLSTELTNLKLQLYTKSALRIQAWYKSNLQRRKFLNYLKAVIAIQRYYKTHLLRLRFLKLRRSAVVIQCYLRGMFGREVARALREMKRVEEEVKKRERELKAGARNSSDKIDLMISDLNLVEKLGESNNANSIEIENMNSAPVIIMDSSSSTPIGSGLSLLIESNESISCDSEDEEEDSTPPPPPLIPPIPTTYHQQRPTLPEPKEPPPPPPPDNGSVSLENSKKPSDEPIYESVVLVRNLQLELEQQLEEQKEKEQQNRTENNASPPPLPELPPAILSPQAPQIQQPIEPKMPPPQQLKPRVERKLQELQQRTVGGNQTSQPQSNNPATTTFLDYALIHFNYNVDNNPSLMSTLTRSNKAANKGQGNCAADFEPLIKFTKNKEIHNSHIKLGDDNMEDNREICILMWRDLNHYMRSDISPAESITAIQTIVSYGIERFSLRNEIYCQIMRQLNGNPELEWSRRLWVLMGLALVGFCPNGKEFGRHLYTFLHENLRFRQGLSTGNNPDASQHHQMTSQIQWCLDYFSKGRRKLPPSTHEINATTRLGTLIIRFFFLDSRSKSIDVSPIETAGEVLTRIAEIIGLDNVEDGWAVYQERGLENGVSTWEEHLPSHWIIYDTVSEWEMKPSPVSKKSNKKSSPNNRPQVPNFTRFIIKRRHFPPSASILLSPPINPINLHLLYTQAHHLALKYYPLTLPITLQLAGLQLQIEFCNNSGAIDYENLKLGSYMPERLINKQQQLQGYNYHQLLQQAHVKYGTNKSPTECKLIYLKILVANYDNPFVSNYFKLINNSLLTNWPQHVVLSISPKFIGIQSAGAQLLELAPLSSVTSININYKSQQIEFELANENAYNFTIPPTTSINEIVSLTRSYNDKIKINNGDRVKAKSIGADLLIDNLLQCRRLLIDSGMLNEPTSSTNTPTLSNLFKKFNKGNRHKSNYLMGDSYKNFHPTYWAWTKINPSKPILKSVDNPIIGDLVYSIINLETAGKNVMSPLIGTLQNLLCPTNMNNGNNLNEIYLQLIKLTTAAPIGSKSNLRIWRVLGVVCSLKGPTEVLIRKYLNVHLKVSFSMMMSRGGVGNNGAGDDDDELKKICGWVEKCVHSTSTTAQPLRPFHNPPSTLELTSTLSLRPIQLKIYLTDGKSQVINLNPNDIVRDVVVRVLRSIGYFNKEEKEDENGGTVGVKKGPTRNVNNLAEDYWEMRGYTLYSYTSSTIISQPPGFSPHSPISQPLSPSTYLTEILAEWEQNKSLSTNQSKAAPVQKFLLKKHLLTDNFMELNENSVEKELIYSQLICQTRAGKFPINQIEAAMLVALRAQHLLGNYTTLVNSKSFEYPDYCHVSSGCLPTQIAASVSHEAVARHHQSLVGMSEGQVKQGVLNLLTSWPRWKGHIFTVNQSFTSTYPRTLWLCIDPTGLHLIPPNSRHTLATFEYTSLRSLTPSPNYILIVLVPTGGGGDGDYYGGTNKLSKIVLSTGESRVIDAVIREYYDLIGGG